MKVMIFGTFDIIHPGHEYVFKEAKKLGEVTAVLARDETVRKIKGSAPLHNEKKRVEQVAAYVDNAVLGYKGDKMRIVEEIKPDVICLGYDQEAFVGQLQKFIAEKKFSMRIIRLKPFKPGIYKGRLLRDKG